MGKWIVPKKLDRLLSTSCIP